MELDERRINSLPSPDARENIAPQTLRKGEAARIMLGGQRQFVLGVLIASLFTPGAAALTEGRLDFESSSPLALDGEFAAEWPSAIGAMTSSFEATTVKSHVNEGVLTIYRWRVASGDVAERRIENIEPTPIPLSNASFEWHAHDEALDLRFIVDDGGRLTLRSHVDDAGIPTRLARPSQRETGLPVWSDGVPAVRVVWEAGWLAAGTMMADQLTPLDEHPDLIEAEALFEGEFIFSLWGGNLTIDGENIRLGNWQDDASPSAGPIMFQHRVIAILEARNASLSTKLSDAWGVAGPDATWHFDGTASLPDSPPSTPSRRPA
jgi:hypothetical protein